MSVEALDLVVNILLSIAFAGTVSFIVLYQARANWRSSPYGRVLMYGRGAMFMFLGYVLVTVWVEPVWWVQFIMSIAICLALALVEWRMFVVLFKTLPKRNKQALWRRKENDG